MIIDPSRAWMKADTGEVKENVVSIITEEDRRRHKEYKNKKEFQHYLHGKYGEFFFYKYDELLNTLNNQVATAFRFLYLCTFADKDNKIKVFSDMYAKKENDFMVIFNKPRKTCSDFCKALKESELIYKDHNGIYRVNEHYYSRKIIDNDDFKHHCIRAFNIAIQELYQRINVTEHTFAGEFLKLIPFMNIYWNVLCEEKDIYNQDSNQIVPLTKQGIQEILRPNSDYGRKLYTKMEKYTIHDEPVLVKFVSGEVTQYIINPRLFYRGNNIKNLEGTINHVKISIAETDRRKMKRRNVGGAE